MIHLETLDGTRYEFNHNIKFLSLTVESLAPLHTTDTIEGRNGVMDVETTYGPRRLIGRFGIVGEVDKEQTQAFRLFNARTFFYIVQGNRRWKVKTVAPFQVDKLVKRLGEFEVEFMAYYPFAESIGTTLNPDDQFQIKSEDFSDIPIQYSFSESSFFVWNDGDVEIDPRENDLIITFEGISTNLTIKNVTTGDEWNYTGTTNNDVIRLDGINAYKNDVSIFKDTNKKLITLAPGWNEFVIEDASDFTIDFDFRFYYVGGEE